MRELLEREQPDALVHLAFVLNPLRDEARMYDIDVNGTAAVLRAASDAGTPPAAGDGPEAEAFARLAAKMLEALDTVAG
jgi:hypothetical protein